MRVSSQKLNPSFKIQIEKTLGQVVADLKDTDSAHTFLKDFLNDSELETLSKRLAIAYWLKKNRSYTNIKRNLKVSSATIANIQKEMTKKGFKEAIKILEAEEWANQWAKKIKNFIK